MADSFSYTLDLLAGPFTAGMGAALSATNRVAAAVTGLGGASLGGLTTGVRTFANVLFMLPDQVRALQGAMTALSWPSKLAASAESTALAFKVLVGDADAANEAMDAIRKLAAETPFEFPELADSARALVAFGEESATVAATLRKIGDIAAGTAQPIGELATLYGKARVAGTLFAEDLNQLTERGVPVLQEFAGQLGVGVDQVKKLASEGKITFPMLEKAFADLTSGGGKFGGMMQTMSEGMEGLESSFSDTIKTIGTEVGKGMNDSLKPLLKEATAQMEGLKGLATQVGQSIGYGIDFTVAAVQAGQLGDLVKISLEEASLRFADGLVSFGMKSVTFLAAALADNLLAAVQGILDGFWAALAGAASFVGLDDMAAEMAKIAEAGTKGMDKARAAVHETAAEVMSDDGPALFGEQIEQLKKERTFKTDLVMKKTDERREDRAAAAEKSPQELADAEAQATIDRIDKETAAMEERWAKEDAAAKQRKVLQDGLKMGLRPEQLNFTDAEAGALLGPKEALKWGLPVPPADPPAGEDGRKPAPSGGKIPVGRPPSVGGGPAAPQRVQLAPGPDRSPEPEEGRGRIRRLGLMETLQHGFERADPRGRGDWMSFARRQMGPIAFDKMSDTARQKLAAADPRRVAAQAADPRVTASGRRALQDATNEGTSQKAAEMIVRFLPDIARHVAREAQKPSK